MEISVDRILFMLYQPFSRTNGCVPYVSILWVIYCPKTIDDPEIWVS